MIFLVDFEKLGEACILVKGENVTSDQLKKKGNSSASSFWDTDFRRYTLINKVFSIFYNYAEVIIIYFSFGSYNELNQRESVLICVQYCLTELLRKK